MAQVISRINQKKLSSLNNQYESANKNEKNQKSFISEKESLMNGETIKVQLVKNNQNKKIYSTKTIDYRTFYKTGSDMNISKKLSNNIQRQNYKLPTEVNDYNNNINSYFDRISKYSDLGNIDRLKKYLIPRNNPIRNSTNINRPRVISTSPSPNYQYMEEENNQRQNNLQNGHKMRDLLSQKFTYNKPKTTSTPSNIKRNPHVYDIKTYCNNNNRNNNIDNISVNSFNANRIEKNKIRDNYSAISFDESPNMFNHVNNNNFMPDIKLDDLIIFDERLNDISVALNNRNNDVDASNECAEFFVFFFHSSLQKIFPSFFSPNNKIVIESANNLTLLAIIIIYHLSLIKDILREVINMVNNILSLLKMNLYLNVKEIQIFYGDEFVARNNFYFKTFNYYLKINSLLNVKEDEIIFKIDHNCRLITNDIKKILKIYQQINNVFYKDFIAIFNNISILSEKDLKDYFYAKLYGFSSSKNNDNKSLSSTKKRKINITKGGKNSNKTYNKSNDNEDDDYNDDNIDNADIISVKSSKSSHYYGKIDKHNFKILQLLNEYEKNKIEPPFITIPNKKKYSLVLDLDETLINLEIKDKTSNKCILHFRPGLFSFLSDMKPFCELITFTSASKEYAKPIINEIELKNKYFDYCLFREHSVICGNDFVKDISRIGRDMKKIIIIDNMEENFRLNKKNGIKIAPYYGDDNDNVLNELKKILFLIFRQGYEDLTIALSDYSKEIKKKISKNA
jgi:Dullard-like phosphatase family protein